MAIVKFFKTEKKKEKEFWVTTERIAYFPLPPFMS